MMAVLPLRPGSVRLMLIRDISGVIVDAEVFFSAEDAQRGRADLILGLTAEFRDYHPGEVTL